MSIVRGFGSYNSILGGSGTINADDGDCSLSLSSGIPDTSDVSVFISEVLSIGITFPIQFLAGIICIRALFAFRSTSNSKLIHPLICHIIALEIANIIGFICILVALQLYLSSGQELLRKIDALLYSAHVTCEDIESLRTPASEVASWLSKTNNLHFVMNVAFTLTGLLTDAMLIWRCRQIWKFTMFQQPNMTVAPPVLLCIGSTGIALLTLCDQNVHLQFRFSLNSTVSMIYFATSLALNVSLTTLIVGRLLKCKMQTQGILGDGYGKHYDLISVLFVESALINAACSAVLLAIFPFGHVPRFNTTLAVCIAVTPAIQGFTEAGAM